MFSHKTTTNSGFSLIEQTMIVLVVGMLAAISIPNLIKMQEKFQTNAAFDQVQGAINQAQLQAIRRSRTCNLTINTTNKTISLANATNDKGCLLNKVILPNSTAIRTSSNNISFNFKGETNTTDETIIVVYNTSKNHKKCLVISTLIGLTRDGFYEGDPSATLDKKSIENCKIKS